MIKVASTKKNATQSSAKKKVVTKKSKNYINPKNYLYAVLILVGGILLALYIFEWYNVKKEEKLMTSYLISSNTIESSITDLDSLSQIIQEAPSSYFIYLSYTGEENIYNLEKNLKRVIDKYKINDIFYYVDLTQIKEKNLDYLEIINKELNIKNIEKIPSIIYVKDGVVKNSDILTSDNNSMLKASDLEGLLKNNEFEVVK